MKQYEKEMEQVLSLGANEVALLPVEEISFSKEFREICKENACGKYDKNWMCPPVAGEIEDLIRSVKAYSSALLYQSVGELEDCFDYEGMMEAAKLHNCLTSKVKETFSQDRYFHLGAGGCHICDSCEKLRDLPCKHPSLALGSLECYGIDVGHMAKQGGLSYSNGENTVTYFSVMFIK